MQVVHKDPAVRVAFGQGGDGGHGLFRQRRRIIGSENRGGQRGKRAGRQRQCKARNTGGGTVHVAFPLSSVTRGWFALGG